MVKSRQTRYRKYVIILSLAFSGFSVLFISIMLKGIVANILVQIDNTLYTQFLSTSERLREDRPPVYTDVVIVGIDDRTLNRLGAYNPMEYRKYHVDLLANILKGEPTAVVYDILFADPHDDPDVDRMLAETMKKGPVFSVCFASAYDRSGDMFKRFAYKVPDGLAMEFVNEIGFESISPDILGSLKGVGLANAYPDNDGLLRKMPIFFKIGKELYPTIALEVFRQRMDIPRNSVLIRDGAIQAGTSEIPVDDHCRAYVNIDRTYATREISFYDVWAGRVPDRFFCDKIVFIAATAAGLGDMKLVPLFGYISGVKIHTNLFLNMLYGNFISEISKTTYYILLFLTSLSYTFLFYTRSELLPIKKIYGYISSVSLTTKFINALPKVPLVNRACEAFKSFRERHYGLRLFFLLFSETRKRLEPFLLQFILLYSALFLIFYYFHFFIRPSALLIQQFISCVIVSEFKKIDFIKISPPERSSVSKERGRNNFPK